MTLPVSSGAEVARLWQEFLDRRLARRSGAEAALRAVIDADPDLAVARAAAALLAVFDDAGFDARVEAARARRGRATHDWERSLVEVVSTTVSQGMWAARPTWTRHHEAFPADLLALTVTVFLTSTSTQPDAFDLELAQVRRSRDAVGEHPLLLGLEAMVAQDLGRIDDCHRLAARALELDPTGFDGGHPMAHVHFEGGDHAGGIAWLDGWLPSTDQEAPFGSHLVWHSALHHLAVGDRDGALERYAHCTGRGGAGGLVDGTSLLWRYQVHGLVPPGTDPSPDPVAPVAARLVDGVPFTFLGVHVALGLATAGDHDGLLRFARAAAGFTAPGSAELLPGLTRGLAAYVAGDHAGASDLLLAQEPQFVRYGGSHAQREVFEDTLIQALMLAGRLPEAAQRLQARLDRRENPLDANLLASTR